MEPETGWSLSANLLVNGDFTNGMTGWSGYPSCFSVDPSTLTPNNHPSMMLNDPVACASSAPLSVNATKITSGFYTIDGYMMADGITGSGGVRMNLFQAGATPLITGSSSWTEETLHHVAVGQGSSAVMRLESYGQPSGTAWFGDLSVQQEIPPAIQAFMLYPNYRGMMFSDQSQVASFDVQLNPPSDVPLQKLRVLLLVHNARGRVVRRVNIKPSSLEFTANVNLSKLRPGPYRIQAMLRAKGKLVLTQSPYEVVKLPASVRSGMKAWIDANNEAHFLDGNAHFVLGIYDTTGFYGTVSQWVPELTDVARAPVNMIINYYVGDAPISSIEDYTTAMANYGMVYLATTNTYYVAGAPGWPSALATEMGATTGDQLISDYALALASNPGVVGYYVQDEPATTLQSETFHQYQLIKQNDPGGFTLAVLNNAPAFSYWRDSVDVIGIDPYPLWGRLGNNLAQVADVTREAVAAVHGARPVWNVIQFFQGNTTSAWPTEQQLHDMSWMAITAGAEGLFYWSHGVRALYSVSDWPWTASHQYYMNQLIRDSNGNIERIVTPGITGPTAPVWPTSLGATTNDGTATWQVVAINETMKDFLYGELIDVTKGIHDLEPVLLATDTPVLSGNSQSGTVFTKEKDVNGIRYVFVYNHSANPVSATFTLASGAGTVTVADEDASGNYSYGSSRQVPLDGQSFTDAFAPYQAHVYEIQ